MNCLLFVIIFVVAFLIAKNLHDKNTTPIAYNMTSSEYHQKHGDQICPKCNKKFVTSLIDGTYDVVYQTDKPDLLCVSEAYCPHCYHSFEIGQTPMATIGINGRNEIIIEGE